MRDGETAPARRERPAPYRAGLIFLAGKGRSGTTLLGRILREHGDVLLLPELNFFEQFWFPRHPVEPLTRRDARAMAQRLAERVRTVQQLPDGADPVAADAVINSICDGALTPPAVLRAFLLRQAEAARKEIPCEQTPRNVFFLPWILELFPQSRVVIVVRDPRGVFAAQRDKWRIAAFGAKRVPIGERFRAWAQAHPILIAAQWRAAVHAGDRAAAHDRTFVVKFEDLVSDPASTIPKICRFLGLGFKDAMLDVPYVGWNYEGSGRRGIDAGEAGRWRGLLTSTEIFLCEVVAGRELGRRGYVPCGARPRLFPLLRSGASLPFHVVGSLLLSRRYHRELLGRVRAARRDRASRY